MLLPADTDPADLRRRAIRSGDLAQWMLADTQVRRLLLIVDTCYSGLVVRDLARNALAQIGRLSHLSEQDGAGVVVVTATQPTQQAVAGVFTAAFARAIRHLAMSANAPRALDRHLGRSTGHEGRSGTARLAAGAVVAASRHRRDP